MFRVPCYPMISKTESGQVWKEILGSGSGSGIRWALPVLHSSLDCLVSFAQKLIWWSRNCLVHNCTIFFCSLDNGNIEIVHTIIKNRSVRWQLFFSLQVSEFLSSPIFLNSSLSKTFAETLKEGVRSFVPYFDWQIRHWPRILSNLPNYLNFKWQLNSILWQRVMTKIWMQH